jgi:hypothetical protein
VITTSSNTVVKLQVATEGAFDQASAIATTTRLHALFAPLPNKHRLQL